jgi:lipoprotein-anchoring transpeptidase ErfK/SrfK
MPRIDISLDRQELVYTDDSEGTVIRYHVSAAAKGAGEKFGSLCTPRGRHIVRAKIGAGQPVNAVFVARRPTGEIYSAELAAQFPGRDWILTRILWLSGREVGFNRLRDVDTMRRYIYIHGSPDSVPMGVPGSIGCVRMHNKDMIDLFNRVPLGVNINIF